MFLCYSLTTDGTLKAGISTNEYECIISDNDVVHSVDVTLLPVLPYAKRTVKDTQLCLAFLEETESADGRATGCVLSMNPCKWNISNDKSNLQLLDPCGRTGNVLVLVPNKCNEFITNSKDSSVSVSTDNNGVPTIVHIKRAKAMLDALR